MTGQDQLERASLKLVHGVAMAEMLQASNRAVIGDSTISNYGHALATLLREVKCLVDAVAESGVRQ